MDSKGREQNSVMDQDRGGVTGPGTAAALCLTHRRFDKHHDDTAGRALLGKGSRPRTRHAACDRGTRRVTLEVAVSLRG